MYLWRFVRRELYGAGTLFVNKVCQIKTKLNLTKLSACTSAVRSTGRTRTTHCQTIGSTELTKHLASLSLPTFCLPENWQEGSMAPASMRKIFFNSYVMTINYQSPISHLLLFSSFKIDHFWPTSIFIVLCFSAFKIWAKFGPILLIFVLFSIQWQIGIVQNFTI